MSWHLFYFVKVEYCTGIFVCMNSIIELFNIVNRGDFSLVCVYMFCIVCFTHKLNYRPLQNIVCHCKLSDGSKSHVTVKLAVFYKNLSDINTGQRIPDGGFSQKVLNIHVGIIWGIPIMSILFLV